MKSARCRICLINRKLIGAVSFPAKEKRVGERTDDLIREKKEIDQAFRQLNEFERFCDYLNEQSSDESRETLEMVEHAVEVGKI